MQTWKQKPISYLTNLINLLRILTSSLPCLFTKLLHSGLLQINKQSEQTHNKAKQSKDV